MLGVKDLNQDAGKRGIEPRWRVLETHVIPDRPHLGPGRVTSHWPTRRWVGDRPVSIRDLLVHSETCRATTPRPPSETPARDRRMRASVLRLPKHLTELHPDLCPRLESNQHLPLFRRTPSPDRLQGHRCGRGGARPRASSAIRLSGSGSIARRICSGTRIRTSTCRVKACRPAISRSPSFSSCFAIKACRPRYRWLPSAGIPLPLGCTLP